MISELYQNMLSFCPECLTVAKKRFTVFDFPVNRETVIKCDNKSCNIPIVRVKASKDKYKLSAECPICSQVHIFNISSKTMWEKNFFILNCPQTGFGILFIGKNEEEVVNAYKSQNDVVAGIVASEDEEEIDLMLDIFERMVEMAKENQIFCHCGAKDISININDEGKLVLKCKKCSHSKEFEIEDDFLEVLSNTDKFEF